MDKQPADSVRTLSIEEVYNGLDYDNSVTVDVGKDGSDVVILEEDFQNGLKAIHRYVDRVITTEDPAFRFKWSKGLLTAVRTRLSAVPTGSFISPAFRATYELSEQARIFLEAEDELKLAEEVPLHRPQAKCWRRRYSIAAHLANELVALIRQKGSSKEFRRRLAIRRFAGMSNFRRGQALINALFDKYAKINVVRIDLSYLREHRPTLEQIKKDFARFLNNKRRNSLFDSCLGVVWRLECGIRTGYHIHVMLFLDGHETLRDGLVAQLFGEYWKWDVTDGRGRFENCNFDKNRYKRLGIGMIHHSETEPGGKRDVLVNIILRYITLVDELARPRVPKGTRTFGASRMPEPHSGRGRKRLELDRTLRSL